MESRWDAVMARWVTNGGTRPIPDFSTLSGAPVFSSRAVDALADLLDDRGDLLPLKVEGAEDQYVFNCTRLSEALDEERSEFKRFTSSGRVMRIVYHEFAGNRLRGETVFRVRQNPKRSEYVTDAFRRRTEEAGLTGFIWDRRVWTAATATLPV